VAYIVITSNRWLLLFLCAITPFQSSGVSEDMPQEDGGHVIESWRVTTRARVFTANTPNSPLPALLLEHQKQQKKPRNTSNVVPDLPITCFLFSDINNEGCADQKIFSCSLDLILSVSGAHLCACAVYVCHITEKLPAGRMTRAIGEFWNILTMF
jgi:hypothetical protein